ncbi:NmrA family transcriptional regulator [Streptomyces sp. WZ.A104]|uniref:NmrA family transcriptional regulator n=1 Tax=Streptomyces durocortorensis TaxID=2811104 RepID=A0ABY9VZI8_9ACTN|nr:MULTISPECIES: NmrA family transcriptional regulator [Streptomyces]PCG82046.1 NmrA family transcriptional regulator [Streptomyces sp. WZ.A104]WNF28372.1 NmrA family transcriptional regulator [Streptomyces durocortorensis]
MTTNEHTTLVLGGTGRVGRRVTKKLIDRGVNVRVGSRAGKPPFDWEDPSTWADAVTGVQSAYLMYYPEVEWPGAGDAIGAVAKLAVDAGVRRLVLLSARNQEEAVRCEDAVTSLPVEWTIVAPASFNQNFDEGVFLEPLRQGVLALPAGDNSDPYVDANDIADVAVAALTEDGHVGERYELTGPRLWTFAEGVEEIARATGRSLRYQPITREQFADAIVADGAPRDFAEPLATLISEFFDGRNSSLADGVERALGRKPRDFADWVAEVAPTGVWDAA